MKEFLIFGIFTQIFILHCLGCVSNPFRNPVTDRPRLVNGVTQGFNIAYRDPAILGRGSKRTNNAEVAGINKAQQKQEQIGTGLSVDINRWRNGTRRLVTVRNKGQENEFVKMSAFNSEGQKVPISPSEFYLSGGSATEIPLTLIPNIRSPNLQTASSDPHEVITVQARGKRDSVERSFYFEDEYNELQPFCFDKDVTGTCRYRTDPAECFRWEWTAYATILNRGGSQKITSIPEGLFLLPGEHGRVRVYLKISCCTPVVQFISNDPYHRSNSCVVDVRDLQVLHPGEIAGIVVAVVVLIIIILVVIFLCLRKRRKETISVGMLPHRARSREVITRQ